MEHFYDGILFSNQKERSTHICCNMDEPWIYYAKWKKPFTHDHIFSDSVFMNCPEQEIYKDRK